MKSSPKKPLADSEKMKDLREYGEIERISFKQPADGGHSEVVSTSSWVEVFYRGKRKTIDLCLEQKPQGIDSLGHYWEYLDEKIKAVYGVFCDPTQLRASAESKVVASSGMFSPKAPAKSAPKKEEKAARVIDRIEQEPEELGGPTHLETAIPQAEVIIYYKDGAKEYRGLEYSADPTNENSLGHFLAVFHSEDEK